MKSMTSKFKGKCFECGCVILAGWPILWSKATGAKHKVCPPAGSVLAAPEKTLPHVHVTELGDFTEVYAMFASAAKTNKSPKISINADGFEFYLYVSGPQAKTSGVINVKGRQDNGWGGKWFGRIAETGTWRHRGEVDERMADALSKLQMDPVGTVAEFGKLGGRCCFCNSSLSDLKSTDVGYGPICAQKWGLPWGKKAKPSSYAIAEAKISALVAEAKKSGMPKWMIDDSESGELTG